MKKVLFALSFIFAFKVGLFSQTIRIKISQPTQNTIQLFDHFGERTRTLKRFLLELPQLPAKHQSGLHWLNYQIVTPLWKLGGLHTLRKVWPTLRSSRPSSWKRGSASNHQGLKLSDLKISSTYPNQRKL
jgi:hypothetical protein